MPTSHPAWAPRVAGAAFLGFALFAAWESESFASVLKGSLGEGPAAAAVWALVGASALFGLLVLLGVVKEPWGSRVSRWVLAGVFLAAAVPKILDPVGFAMDISNYAFVPKVLVNLVALTLPWVEALTALCLLAGALREGAVLLVNLMMVAFLIALAQAGIRGLDINCGCFGHSGAAEPVLKALVRDLFFLGWSFPLLFTERE